MRTKSSTHAPRRALLTAAVAFLCNAAPVFASGSAPSPPPRQVPPPSDAPAAPPNEARAEEKEKLLRAEAELLYARGYEEVQEAKKERQAGKADAAKKKFGKALKKFEGAVDRDGAYYQAWNMVGYCARNLGDLKRAFAAYEKCLTIQPDYDEAHEYLGEAFIQSGDLAKAKIQLAWLRAHDSEEAGELAEKIAAAEGKPAPTETKAAPAEDKTPPAETKPAEASGTGEGSGSR